MGLCGSALPSDVIDVVEVNSQEETKGAETSLHSRALQVISEGRRVLAYLSQYPNSNDAIGPSLAKPHDEERRAAALKVVIPKVREVYAYYQLGLAAGKLIRDIVHALSHVANAYSAQPDLGQDLVWLLDLLIEVDYAKMRSPGVQNDFSYYRRSTASMDLSELPFGPDKAAVTSMFIAEASPILKHVEVELKNRNTAEDNTALGRFANVAANTMRVNRFGSDRCRLACARSMCCAIVLYDRTLAASPFAEVSACHVNTEACVQQLASLGPRDAKLLRNVLRFSSRTYKSQATAHIRTLVEV